MEVRDKLPYLLIFVGLLSLIGFIGVGTVQGATEYNVTVNISDTNGNDVFTGTPYEIVNDTSGDVVVSGTTPSASEFTEQLANGTYTLRAGDGSNYGENSTTFTVDGGATSVNLTLEEYAVFVTLNTTDTSGNALNASYEVVNQSSGATYETGTTGTDGSVEVGFVLDKASTLYNFSATYDGVTEYQTDVEPANANTVSLSFAPSYNFTLSASNSSGNAVNTTYKIEDSAGTVVASGNTGSDGNVTETLTEGNYTATLAGGDAQYATTTQDVNLTADTTVSKNLSLAQYDVTVNTQNESGQTVNVSYRVLDESNTQFLREGYTGSDGSFTVTLEYGKYNIIVANYGDSPYQYQYVRTSEDGNLTTDRTYDATLSLPSSNLTVNATDSSGTAINTTYEVVSESSGNTVASGSTGSDGLDTVSIEDGNYTVSIAGDDPQYDTASSSVNLTSDSTTNLSTSVSSYSLTVNATDGSGNAVNTTYSIEDSSGNTVASGDTGTDGSVTQTLKYGDYTVTLAGGDSQYSTSTQTVTLDSNRTVSSTLSTTTYTLTVNATNSSGTAINTSYVVEDSSGTVVASGDTGADGSALVSVEQGDYTVTVAGDDPQYDTASTTVSVSSDTSTTLSTSESTYTLTINTTGNYSNPINETYTVEDSSGNVVASGSTGADGEATVNVTSGDYTIITASGGTQYHAENQTVSVSGSQTVNTTHDQIRFTVDAQSTAIYTGQQSTFDADVANRDDTQYSYNWYVNGTLVEQNHEQTFNYTFNSSGQYVVKAETVINEQNLTAYRTLPNYTWVNVTDSTVDAEKKVEFATLRVRTYDGNTGEGVVTDHTVNANLTNYPGEERTVRSEKNAKVSYWDVISTHPAYVTIQHDGQTYYENVTREEMNNLNENGAVYVQIDVGNTSDGVPDGQFGYDYETDGDGGIAFVQSAFLIDDDDDAPEQVTVAPDNSTGQDGILALLPILVIGGSLLFLIGGFSLLGILTALTGGEGFFDGDGQSINPLRFLQDDD